MSATKELAGRYVRNHPAEAARVVELATPADAAAFLETIGVDAAAGLLRFMNVGIAAAALSAVEVEYAALIVDALPPSHAAFVLRPMERAAAERVLEHVEERTARSLKRLLRYREGAAGWLADPQALTLAHDIRAGEAQKLLRRMAGEAHYNVYVLDRDQRLVGVVTIRELLTARPKQTLESIMRSDPIRVRANADLASVAADPAWEEFDMLPVVDKADAFLGVIRHKTIRQLMDRRVASPDIADLVDVALRIADMYWRSLSGLATGVSVAAGSRRYDAQHEIRR